jgi:hypothetical protein
MRPDGKFQPGSVIPDDEWADMFPLPEGVSPRPVPFTNEQIWALRTLFRSSQRVAPGPDCLGTPRFGHP